MNAGRVFEVARRELGFTLRRPMLWVLVLLLALMSWGMSGGNVRISSGDTSVGGSEAFITSQFSQAFILSLTILTFYSFFLAVAAGMSVIRDEEHKVVELLQSTLLSPAEYVWGKFLAVIAAFLGVMGLHVAMSMFFNHVLADAASAEYIGRFAVGNYVVPALAFGLPTLMFLGGTAFAVGERTRSPILVFVLPVVVMLASLTFLISWSPSWLSLAVNRFLMAIEPSGYRWLNETWLKVDRGVDFYNTAPIGFDPLFVVSRLGFVLLGVAAVYTAQRHFARALAGPTEQGRLGRWIAGLGNRMPWRHADADCAEPVAARPAGQPISALGMSQSPPGFLRAMLVVARAEVRELLTRPGLYLFVPLIMLQATANVVTTVVAFDAPALQTPGTMAVGMVNTLNLLVCLLLLFYMVESLQREYSANFAQVFYATPAPTGSILFGKAIGTSLVGIVVLGAVLLVCLLILGWQRLVGGSPVPVGVTPFVITWGLVLVPTFVLWTAFVSTVFAVTRNRYTTYAISLGVVFVTMREIVVGDGLSWLTNWMGWGAVIWSDMGLFPLNWAPMLWNRTLALAVAAFFVFVSVRWFARRERDPQRTIQRFQPKPLAWAVLGLVPALVVPVALAVPLGLRIGSGFQSESEEKVQKDYWRKNLATWRDADNPAIAHVDLDIEMEPAERWQRVEGTYRLTNYHDHTLQRWAVTPGRYEEITWSIDGEPYEPEDRAGLQVFDHPLESEADVELGFSYEAYYPKGFNKNGGGAGQYILDAGVVVTSFGPSWVPSVGYIEQVGIDEDNSYEPREYPDDFYEGITPSGFGNEGPPYTSRIAITLPEEYAANSVGVKVQDRVRDGYRTVVWESDHPVTFFNLVAGRWDVWEGDGTAIYYHPEHAYNLEEMGRALDASRRYYSEWFYPYPWELLKLSEFPALATYAQGFPTNITFSEGIGFLTKNDPRARTAFLVTAHEAAHQWWGNLLTPGQGPGGNILSEGMSHYSTLMLTDQVLGLGHRIELAKRLESRYNNNRQVDSERPLVKIDGSRGGDTTVTYDKGGWVAWMLMDLMGRENMLAGLQEFIATFNPSPDHPVLQDLVATLRPHAPDPEAFGAFVQQWFFEVVVPEYRLRDAAVDFDGENWRVTAQIENVGTATMDVEVAAVRGVRFPDLEEEDRIVVGGSMGTGPEEAPATVDDGTAADAEPYHDSRARIRLAAGESVAFEIVTDFEPERLIVDPDAMVLQLRRERAELELDG